MGVQVRTGRINLRAVVNHDSETRGISVERREDERRLPLPGGRFLREALRVLPAMEAKSGRQGECRAPREQMVGGSGVSIDQRIIGRSLGRRTRIDENVDQRDLHVAFTRNPRLVLEPRPGRVETLADERRVIGQDALERRYVAGVDRGDGSLE